MARPITGEGDVGVPVAEGFETLTVRAGSGKSEVEAAIGAEMLDCRAKCIDVVGEAEIAGIEDPYRLGGWERKRIDFSAVRPVIGDVDSFAGNAAADQTL